MAEMCEEIMRHSDKLDVCEHGKERQDCKICRKPSIFDEMTKRLATSTEEKEDAPSET